MNKQALLRFGRATLDAAVVVVVLGVIAQNRFLASRLRGQAEILEGATQGPGGTVAGRLNKIAAVNLDGNLEQIALPDPGRRLLIIAMSPHCPACQANREKWIALSAALAARDEWRVVWVSRDPLEETRRYFALLGTNSVHAVADPPLRTYEQLGLRVIPRTISVLAGGKVDRVWTGSLEPAAWQEAFSYFGLEKPVAPR